MNMCNACVYVRAFDTHSHIDVTKNQQYYNTFRRAKKRLQIFLGGYILMQISFNGGMICTINFILYNTLIFFQDLIFNIRGGGGCFFSLVAHVLVFSSLLITAHSPSKSSIIYPAKTSSSPLFQTTNKKDMNFI